MKKPKRKSPRNSSEGARDFIKYSNVAFRMIVIILAGVFSGLKLDEYFGNEKSIFTLVLTLVSVVVAMYVIIREISNKQ